MKITNAQTRALAEIMVKVTLITFISKEELLSKRRYKDIVLARHLYHTFALKYTKCTLSSIASTSNVKSHATVFHSRKVISNLLETNHRKCVRWHTEIDNILLKKLSNVLTPKTRLIKLIKELEDTDTAFELYINVMQVMLKDLNFFKDAREVFEYEFNLNKGQ